MKTAIVRREFLKVASRSLGLFALSSSLMDTIVAEVMNKAIAAEEPHKTPANPTGYYLHLAMGGAPPQWYGLLPLTPFAAPTASNFKSGSFGTKMQTTGGVSRPVYDPIKMTVKGKTFYLPPVWNMPTASGGSFSHLLENMAIFRGMLDVNSHILGPALSESPLLGNYSTAGVVADGSIFPIPAIVDPNSYASSAFRSVIGYSPLAIPGGSNIVASLLTPFQDFRGSRYEFAQGNVELEEQAFKQFETYAMAKGLTQSTLSASYENAMSLINEGIYPALTAKWASTYAKYNSIVNDAMQPAKGDLPGFFDKPIPTDVSGFFSYVQVKPVGGKITYTSDDCVTLPDARDMITSNTTTPNMAANFAVAEILLGQVTASMILNFGSVSGLSKDGTKQFGITNDQHYIGAGVSTIATTLLWRALFASTGELVNQMKANGMYDSTVIYISSEFNRQMRADGSGSDHNFEGNTCAMISGMIDGLNITGNIQIDPTKSGATSSNYPGTSGIGANYPLKGTYGGVQRPINFNDMVRTMRALLSLPTDIVTNGNVLLSQSAPGMWSLPSALANEAQNV